MLFFPSGSGTWTIPVTRRQLRALRSLAENGEAYRFVPDCPPEQLQPGEFTTRHGSEFAPVELDAEVVFHPRDTVNPNLDDKTYRLGDWAVKWPERRPCAAAADGMRVDLLAEPKWRDFARSFWHDRAAETVALDTPGRTVVYRAIGNAGAASLQASVVNSGWRVAITPHCGELALRAMQALSVGARDLAQPHYPPLVFCHHTAQVGAVLPGATHISFLRDPIRRVVSTYHWERDRGNLGGTLDGYVDYICDVGCWRTQMDWLARLSVPLEHSLTEGCVLPYFVEQGRGGARMSEQLIRAAHDNLGRFLFLGITECFDESLMLAALLTGSRHVGRWPWACRSSASDGFTLSDRARRRLEAYLEPEIALYQDVRRRFEQHYAEELAFIRRTLEPLRLPSG